MYRPVPTANELGGVAVLPPRGRNLELAPQTGRSASMHLDRPVRMRLRMIFPVPAQGDERIRRLLARVAAEGESAT